MIRDILVHIPTEHPQRPVVDASVSLAASFGAHLDAIAIGYIWPATGFRPDPDAAAAVGAAFEAERERATERAATALAIFETEARNAGIAYASHRPPTSRPARLSRSAPPRLYDLAIVLQPEAERQDNTILREILLQAGGPVLFIPHIFRGAFKAKRIGICWDGSRLAARALRDARPFLAQADRLLAISISGADSTPAEASGDKLAKHLALAGLPVRVIKLPAAPANIQPSVLSVAADENLEMLVMGAYGHSHLQEGILGGVTRAMLGTMTVPTLISH